MICTFTEASRMSMKRTCSYFLLLSRDIKPDCFPVTFVAMNSSDMSSPLELLSLFHHLHLAPNSTRPSRLATKSFLPSPPPAESARTSHCHCLMLSMDVEILLPILDLAAAASLRAARPLFSSAHPCSQVVKHSISASPKQAERSSYCNPRSLPMPLRPS